MPRQGFATIFASYSCAGGWGSTCRVVAAATFAHAPQGEATPPESRWGMTIFPVYQYVCGSGPPLAGAELNLGAWAFTAPAPPVRDRWRGSALCSSWRGPTRAGATEVPSRTARRPLRANRDQVARAAPCVLGQPRRRRGRIRTRLSDVRQHMADDRGPRGLIHLLPLPTRRGVIEVDCIAGLVSPRSSSSCERQACTAYSSAALGSPRDPRPPLRLSPRPLDPSSRNISRYLRSPARPLRPRPGERAACGLGALRGRRCARRAHMLAPELTTQLLCALAKHVARVLHRARIPRRASVADSARPQRVVSEPRPPTGRRGHRPCNKSMRL